MQDSLLTRVLRWIGAATLTRDAPHEALEQVLCALGRKQSELTTELGRAAVRRYLAQKRSDGAVHERSARFVGQPRHTRALEHELALARHEERECERYLLLLSEQIEAMQEELARRESTTLPDARRWPIERRRGAPSSEP